MSHIEKMNNNQTFNLEKIKEFSLPIEKLQVNLNQMSEESRNINLLYKNIENNFNNRIFVSQIKEIKEILSSINKNLILISNNNITKFLDFQDSLLKKFKDGFKDRIKNLNLSGGEVKIIGLNLIEGKKISKIIETVSFVSSIELSLWVDLLDSLKYNTYFLKSISKMRIYYEDLLQKKLKRELNKIPNDTDQNLINEFEQAFIVNPDLIFEDFIHNSENLLTQKELNTKEKIIKVAKAKEELEQLKKTQEKHKDTYEDYFKFSEREFKRLRRKESREKLMEITTRTKDLKELEISDEVSEKIKKFKSQLDKSFEEKYLVQKDDEKDPLDLIRKRKERKEKEYKKYKNHFEK